MPTVVGATITLSLGYDCSRPWASWNDFWSSSLPYAVLTSLSLLFSGLASSVFMTSIQEFWFVAFGVADRIAITPPSGPACSLAIFTRLSPMPCVVAWLMKTSRQSLAASESNPTILIFAALACFSDGHTAFGSLAAIAITSCCCWISVLMYETCEEALASFGPTSLYSPLSSPSAALPPLTSTSEYGL